MDGRGRWMDNVFIKRLWRSLKHEDVYLKGYVDGREARAGIAAWIAFYNERRPHQGLGDRMPTAVWRDGTSSPETDTVAEARASIGRCLDFYNAGRPHSQHGGRTPDQVWFASLPLPALAA